MTADLLSLPDPAASPPWPLAVGVLLLPDGVSGASRAEHRLVLALDAYRIGYFLLDVVEVHAVGSSVPRACDWVAVERIVRRAGADALVVRCIAPVVFPGRLPDTLTTLPLRLLAD
jgi:hypothetical protein